MQKTPLSATALGTEQLEARGINGFTDIAEGGIPSLRVTPFVGRSSAFNISMRGISTGDPTQISRDPGVGIYIDGVYLGRVQGMSGDLFEVERMEVLRGPQGTLFGRNAVGGAVNIISKKPTGQFGFQQIVDVGNYDGLGLVTRVNLPEFAGISIRVDGVLRKRDGWVSNPMDGYKGYGDYNRKGIRVAALWQPAPNFSVLYSFDKSRDATTTLYGQAGGIVSGFPMSPLAPVEPHRVKRARLGAPLEPAIGKVEGHGLTASWAINDDMELKSITAWRKVYQTQFAQGLGFEPFSPNGLLGTTSTAKVNQHQFSQEIQLVGTLDRLQYALGGFYFDEDAHDSAYRYSVARWNADGTDYTILSTPVGGTPPDRASVNHAKSYALFGQVTYTPPIFDDRLHLTGGLRYTKDKKNGALTMLRGVSVPNFGYRFTSSRVDPSVSLGLDVADNVQAYVRWGVAYRAGGANSRSLNFTPFGEEEVRSWEAGLKTEFWGRRGRFNIAAFTMGYSDVQMDFLNPLYPSNIETRNADTKIRVKGIEIDVALRPVRGLTLDASYSYLDTSPSTATNPFTDKATISYLTFAPRHAGSGSIDYRMEETEIGTPYLHFDGNFSSGSHALPGQAFKTDSYFTANGRVGLDDIRLGGNSGTLRATLWMKNIFNEEHVTFNGDVVFGVTDIYNAPRTYGLELSYRF
ncbi:MAG: TonB-dependent receptor [Sphingobium sp.]